MKRANQGRGTKDTSLLNFHRKFFFLCIQKLIKKKSDEKKNSKIEKKITEKGFRYLDFFSTI